MKAMCSSLRSGGVAVWRCGEYKRQCWVNNKGATQERRTQEEQQQQSLAHPHAISTATVIPFPTNLPDTFPDCVGDRCFARTSTTGNGNDKNWFIKEALGRRAWFAITAFDKRGHLEETIRRSSC